MRLAYFVSHPIQYQAPLLRLIAKEPDIELKVFFYSDFSLKAYQDPGFGKSIKWDIPLTEGYDYQFLKCWGSQQRHNWHQQPIATNIHQLLKQGKFDAVWVHGWAWLCSLQAILAAEHLEIPILLRGDSNVLLESNHLLKTRVKQIFLNWLFEKVATFLYVGTLNYQFYQSYGVNRERLFPMPYAVDNDYFHKQALLAHPNQESLRQSLNLIPGRPIILYAGKLIDVKRPKDLLRAYSLLSPDALKEPEAYLLFVGDGALRQELEAEANAIGWHSIRFLGFRNQSEMPAIYDLCDVFVLPSDFEQWGLAINEVMNAGKAIIVSDKVGCAPDLVVEGQNGRVFHVGDIKALAEAMQWAISQAKSAGEASFNHIQSWSFSQDISGIKASLAGIER